MNTQGENSSTSAVISPEPILERLSPEPQESSPNCPNKNLHLHYKTIGESLLIAEAATTYGIPVLYPTARIRNRQKSYFPTISDFTRSSLISVPTFALESYVEDLIELPQSSQSESDLHIAGVSTIERWGLGMLVISLAFGLSLFVGLLSQTGVTKSLSIAFLIAAILCLIYQLSSDDKSRRRSFISLLSREIRRRKGQGSKNLSPMALCLRVR